MCGALGVRLRRIFEQIVVLFKQPIDIARKLAKNRHFKG